MTSRHTSHKMRLHHLSPSQIWDIVKDPVLAKLSEELASRRPLLLSSTSLDLSSPLLALYYSRKDIPLAWILEARFQIPHNQETILIRVVTNNLTVLSSQEEIWQNTIINIQQTAC